MGRKIVLVDPPWQYKTWSGKNQTRNADQHYACMTNQELLDLKPYIAKAFGDDAVMAMWCTPSNMKFAIQLLEHWGFTYKTIAFSWAKLNKLFMKEFQQICKTNQYVPATESDAIASLEHLFFPSIGHWTRSNVEHVIIGKKGKTPLQRMRKDVRQLVFAPVDEHSKKPDEVNKRLELLLRRPQDQMYELFARRQYSDWWCTGLELDQLYVHEALDMINEPFHVRLEQGKAMRVLDEMIEEQSKQIHELLKANAFLGEPA